MTARSRALAFVCTLALADCDREPATTEPAREPVAERLYTEEPVTWFEDVASSMQVSSDGKRATYGGPGRVGLVDLSTGKVRQPIPVHGEEFSGPNAFRGDALTAVGVVGDKRGWFLEGASGLEPLPLPLDVWPMWSPDGRSVAYFRFDDSSGRIHLGPPDKATEVPLPGRVTGIAWAPDSSKVYALTVNSEGVSALLRIPADDRRVELVVGDLDTATGWNPFAVDATHAYIALASKSTAGSEAAVRHDPAADRDLDIYAIDLVTGRRRVVVESAVDDFSPRIAAGHLYWITGEVRAAVALVPAGGGSARQLISNAELPTWSPDGKRIAFTVWSSRLADWALDMEAFVADVNAASGTLSSRKPIVTGYHEDFSPVWSPDGRWLAYHSHRSAKPVGSYSAEGSTDDVYVRRADAPMSAEIRVSDFGWEVGMPDWSPDGRRIVFGSWDRKTPGLSVPWIATLNPRTGRALTIERLRLPASIKSGEWMIWSPDGREIALEERTSRTTHSLWIVKADGSAATKLVEYPMRTYGGLDWMPSGDALVYAAQTGQRIQLYTVPRSGGEPRTLTDDTRHLLHPQVSPDGQWIACTRLQVVKTIWRKALRR